MTRSSLSRARWASASQVDQGRPGHHRSRRGSLMLLVGALLAPSLTAYADRPVSGHDLKDSPVTTLAVRFYVAQQASGPVVTEDFLRSTVQRSSEIFDQAGIRLVLGEVVKLPVGKHLKIYSRGGRDLLAKRNPLLDNGVVEVFVVGHLSNLDPGARYPLSGVHWRHRWTGKTSVGRHYVILGASTVGVETLAHELGHYFGLPHYNSRRNIMRPGSGRVAAELRPWQVRQIRRRLRLFLDLGILKPVDPAAAPGVVSRPAEESGAQ